MARIAVYIHITMFFVLQMIPTAICVESVTKPTVVLPANWYLESETPYPNAPSEYDPQGAGLLIYVDREDYDFVMIKYERAPASALTEDILMAKAIAIFQRDHPGESIDSYGTMPVAGVITAYAKGYDSTYDTYDLELVFIKSKVFFNVYACYDATSQDEAQVMSILNSISVHEPSLIETQFPYIVISVALVIAVICAVIYIKRRRRQAQAATPQQGPWPPPPP